MSLANNYAKSAMHLGIEFCPSAIFVFENCKKVFKMQQKLSRRQLIT